MVQQNADIKISAAVLKKAKGTININYNPVAHIENNISGASAEELLQLKFMVQEILELFEILKNHIAKDCEAITFDNFEKLAIDNALAITNGHKGKAAKLLKCSRDTLYTKMYRLNMRDWIDTECPRYRGRWGGRSKNKL